MKLKVFGSGSAGNCYLVYNKEACLIIEAGINPDKVISYLNYDISKIEGVLISHMHKDHSKYAKEYAEKYGLKIYTAEETANTLNIDNYIKIKYNNVYNVGSFKVKPFEIQHDCEGALGFLINHKETGNIAYITDSYYIKYRLPNVVTYLIETNFSHDIMKNNIENGKIKELLAKRIISTHMSLETAIDTLKNSDLSLTKNIILIHLSENNSDKDMFLNKFRATFADKDILIHVANKDNLIDISLINF
jgi:phosphoribosyl 1,2-cyclic phosphodiesterase